VCAWARHTGSLCALPPPPLKRHLPQIRRNVYYILNNILAVVFRGGWEGVSSVYNTNIMDTKIPQPVHLSYKRHRRELATQIILPIILTVALIIAAIVLVNIATFRDGGDVARWAAVSTIWIVIPIMIGMLIFLALLIGLIYLIGRLLNVTPTYTSKAQDYVRKAAVYIKKGADAVVRPVIGLEGFAASVKKFLGRE